MTQGIHARSLPDARGKELLALGEDDGVGAAVLHNLVGKNHVVHFIGGRCLGGDDLEVVSGLSVKVAVLHEVAVQGSLHRLGPVKVGFQAQHDAVLLREEQVEYAVFIFRGHDDFDEQLVDLLGSLKVDGTVAHQHATESRDGVASQSGEVSLFHGLAAGDATGVVVLEDGEGRLVELTDEVETCVEVEQVVVRQLFAVQLLEHRVEVAIEGAFLMRVLTITQGRAFFFGDTQRLRCVVFREPVHDSTVVMRADAKGVGGKTTAVVDGGLTMLLFQQLDEFAVILLRRHDEHVVEVLRAGANQRNATDVDFLDDGRRIFGLGHGLLEGIEVDNDEVEGRDVVFLHLLLVRGKLGATQDAAKHFRMQGLHATAQDGRIARERLDGIHRRIDRLDEVIGSPCGVNLYPVLLQQVDDGVDTRFIKY